MTRAESQGWGGPAWAVEAFVLEWTTGVLG
jgi:hypothetical protein